MHVERAGTSGATVLLLHGSLAPGWATWDAQRPLADRYRLVVPHRSGYPPNPPLDRLDFERQADEVAAILEPGTHLVGHSYGGVVSLLVAGRPEVRLASLTVIEPPAFGLARGVDAADALVERLIPIFRDASDPRRFFSDFTGAVGSTRQAPDPLPPELEGSLLATMRERYPWEAEPPLDRIAASGLPVLVVSGGHHPAFDAVCDVLETRLDAQRAVIPGAGHTVPRTGEPFNRCLTAFIDAVAAR